VPEFALERVWTVPVVPPPTPAGVPSNNTDSDDGGGGDKCEVTGLGFALFDPLCDEVGLAVFLLVLLLVVCCPVICIMRKRSAAKVGGMEAPAAEEEGKKERCKCSCMPSCACLRSCSLISILSSSNTVVRPDKYSLQEGEEPEEREPSTTSTPTAARKREPVEEGGFDSFQPDP